MSREENWRWGGVWSEERRGRAGRGGEGRGDVPGRQQQKRRGKKQEKSKCGKERFIVKRGWSILRRDSRAWRGRNKRAMWNKVPGV